MAKKRGILVDSKDFATANNVLYKEGIKTQSLIFSKRSTAVMLILGAIIGAAFASFAWVLI